MMKEMKHEDIQKAGYEILVEFDRICNELKLKYVLAYGSLLGAVRHGGFIPWDDDMDVWMPREDYEAFLEYCEKTNLGNYRIINHKTENNVSFMISRFSSTKQVLEFFDNFNSHRSGLFLDVYPLDYIGNSMLGAKLFLMGAFCYKMVYRCIVENKIGQGTGKIGRCLYKIVNIYAKKKCKEEWIEKYNRYATSRNGRGKMKYYSTPIIITYKLREVFPSDMIDNRIKMPFEGSEFWVPKDYDLILSRIYGNYKELPPIEKQQWHRHGYIAYSLEDK